MDQTDAFLEQKTTLSRSNPSTFLVSVYAWIALLLGSSLSPILWIAWLGYKQVPVWDVAVRLLGIAGILVLTYLWPTLRALRGFVWALLAFASGTLAKEALTTLPPIATWLHSLPAVEFRLADALLGMIFPVAFMALTLIGSGLSRRELFLTRGDMRARGRMLLPFLPRISWMWLALLVSVVFLGPILAQLISLIRPDVVLARHVLVALPVILAVGLIRSFQEDFRFRIVFLARLAPTTGARQALLMSSLLFGLVYWMGASPPNGWLGALISGVAGWILGASILETRGIAWIWIIHALAETLAVTILVMTTVH